MLVLPFCAAGDRFGLSCADVVEVLPAIPLQRVPHAPACVAGLFSYRGAVTPVVDLGLLLGSSRSRPALSTRMVLVTCAGGKLGLLAEEVAAPAEIEDDEIGGGFEVNVKSAPYLGDVVSVDGQVLQMIHVRELVSPELRDMFFGGA